MHNNIEISRRMVYLCESMSQRQTNIPFLNPNKISTWTHGHHENCSFPNNNNKSNFLLKVMPEHKLKIHIVEQNNILSLISVKKIVKLFEQ